MSIDDAGVDQFDELFAITASRFIATMPMPRFRSLRGTEFRSSARCFTPPKVGALRHAQAAHALL